MLSIPKGAPTLYSPLYSCFRLAALHQTLGAIPRLDCLSCFARRPHPAPFQLATRSFILIMLHASCSSSPAPWRSVHDKGSRAAMSTVRGGKDRCKGFVPNSITAFRILPFQSSPTGLAGCTGALHIQVCESQLFAGDWTEINERIIGSHHRRVYL